MQEKEKILLTSICSFFSHTVFCPPRDKSYESGRGNCVNFLPNDKILNWSKLKAFTDDKRNVNEVFKFGF